MWGFAVCLVFITLYNEYLLVFKLLVGQKQDIWRCHYVDKIILRLRIFKTQTSKTEIIHVAKYN